MGLSMSDFVGPLINLAGNTANSFIQQSNNRANMYLQKRLNAEQMYLSDQLNRNYQKFLWDNSIPAEVSGMKMAGLNPAISSGTVSAGTNPESLPAGGSPLPGANPNFDLAGSMYAAADLRLKNAQAKELESEAQKNLQDVAWKEFQNSPEYKDLVLEGMENENIKSIYDAFKSQSDIEVNDRSIAKIAEEINGLRVHYNLENEQVAYIAMQTNQLQVATENLKKQGKLLDKDIKYYDVKVAVDRAIARYNNAGADYYGQLRVTEEFRTGSLALDVLIQDYTYQVLSSIDPELRAYGEIAKEVIGLIISSIKAFKSPPVPAARAKRMR